MTEKKKPSIDYFKQFLPSPRLGMDVQTQMTNEVRRELLKNRVGRDSNNQDLSQDSTADRQR